MKPIFTMVLKDKESFAKLKDCIDVWKGLDARAVTVKDRDYYNSIVLTRILAYEMDSAMVTYNHSPSTIIYDHTKKVTETILTVVDYTTISRIIDYYCKFFPCTKISELFTVRDDAIIATVEKDNAVITLEVRNYGELKRPAPPVVEVATDNDEWFEKLSELASAVGIPLQRKVESL